MRETQRIACPPGTKRTSHHPEASSPKRSVTSHQKPAVNNSAAINTASGLRRGSRSADHDHRAAAITSPYSAKPQNKRHSPYTSGKNGRSVSDQHPPSAAVNHECTVGIPATQSE